MDHNDEQFVDSFNFLRKMGTDPRSKIIILLAC